MPDTNVIAQEGQTLCELAIAAGFLNCQPIRDLGSNAGKSFLTGPLKAGDVVAIPAIEKEETDKGVEATHQFVKESAPPFGIRFVHGSPDKPYRQDPEVTVLHISNFPTNKAGPNVNSAFPSDTKFSQLGHDDIDTFKVEVVDPGGPATVDVTLEALRPIFKADGSVDHFEPFSGPAKAKRTTTVTAKQVASKVCYRSPYLRLVVDERDQQAVPKQTLLIADLTDGKDGDNDKVEILGQRVRASYARTSCPAPQKCTAVVEAPVGENVLKVKLAVHILKDPANGNPLSNEEQVRRTLLMYLRQVYAQADMSMKLVAKTRDIVAPANMFVVDDFEGRRAVGGGKIEVRVQVGTTTDKTVSIITNKDDTCETTAGALRDAIKAAMPADVDVKMFPNPPTVGKTRGSADVVIGNPLTQDVRLTVVTSGDAKQPVRVAAITNAVFDTGSGNERHTGNINSRCLLNNYDSGRDRIDVFVVGNMPTLLGLAFPCFKKYTTKYGHGSARDEVANSFLVNFTTLHQPGQPENFYTTIPHEIGHVLVDAVHTPTSRPTELMGPGSPVGSDERVVNGCKRITDLQKIQFDDNIKDVPVTMFRENDTEVLE